MAENNQKAEDNKKFYRYKPVTLYFDKSSKEDMDIYHFLTGSPRKKTNFIIRLLTKYLHDNGVMDIGNITQDKAEYLMKMSINFNGNNTVPVVTASATASSEELIKLLTTVLLNVNRISPTALMQTQANQFSLPISCDNSCDEKPKYEKNNNFQEKDTIQHQESSQNENKYADEVSASDENISDLNVDDHEELDSEDSLLGNWREGLNAFI